MYRQDSPLHVDERSHAGRVAPQFRSPEKVLLDIRNRIDDAAKKQRDLSNSRENLLARRERTRASSKRVQAKRSEAGDAEAAFMDYIRDFMSSTTTPSFEMINLYNRVESARNDLGAMEADHQQLERSLSGADWMLKEEEDEFYQYGLTELFEGILEPVDQLSQDVARPVPLGPFQSMLPPPPPPPPPPHPVPAPPPALPPPLSPFIPSLVARSSDARSPWLQASHNQYQGVPLPPPRGVSSVDLHLSTPVAHSSLSQFAQTQGELQHLPVIKASDFEPAEANDIELDGLGDQFDSVSSPDPGLLEARDISASNDPSMLDFESLPSLSPTVLASDIHSKGLSYGWHHGTATSDTANDRFLTTHVPFNGRRLSDPTNYENKDLTIPQTLERSLSENTAYDMHRGRAAKNRVRAWLMSILVDSHMEKTLYYNILEATLEENGFHYPDHEPWGLPATQYWSRDSRSSFETDPFDKNKTTHKTKRTLSNDDA
ncbi:protocadherin- 15 [Didymella heteroderae]|uniref:Protocadherin- 15 n=1 Tax=Didymella heteroderae TaxID=1769908 RepID=A0A9P4WKW8_9PLEO|nr:protocadherin- 15 [Didymella heteroderae]